jgi:hypothetical protein
MSSRRSPPAIEILEARGRAAYPPALEGQRILVQTVAA